MPTYTANSQIPCNFPILSASSFIALTLIEHHLINSVLHYLSHAPKVIRRYDLVWLTNDTSISKLVCLLWHSKGTNCILI